MTNLTKPASEQPFDHNGECTFCDEQAAHRADCPWLLERLEELEEYDHSFLLYEKASMALMHAYKGTHPEVPENVWPDTGEVNAWAAAEIERLTAGRETLIAEVDHLTGEAETITDDRTVPRKAVQEMLDKFKVWPTWPPGTNIGHQMLLNEVIGDLEEILREGDKL